MTLSGVIAALQKLTPLVGDAEVILRDVGTGVETVVQALSLDLTAAGDATGSTVTVKHGPAPTPAPAVEPAADAPPVDPSASPS